MPTTTRWCSLSKTETNSKPSWKNHHAQIRKTSATLQRIVVKVSRRLKFQHAETSATLQRLVVVKMSRRFKFQHAGCGPEYASVVDRSRHIQVEVIGTPITQACVKTTQQSHRKGKEESCIMTKQEIEAHSPCTADVILPGFFFSNFIFHSQSPTWVAPPHPYSNQWSGGWALLLVSQTIRCTKKSAE